MSRGRCVLCGVRAVICPLPVQGARGDRGAWSVYMRVSWLTCTRPEVSSAGGHGQVTRVSIKLGGDRPAMVTFSFILGRARMMCALYYPIGNTLRFYYPPLPALCIRTVAPNSGQCKVFYLAV